MILLAMLACGGPVVEEAAVELAPGPPDTFGWDSGDTGGPPLPPVPAGGALIATYTANTQAVMAQSTVCYTIVPQGLLPGPLGVVAVGMEDGLVALVGTTTSGWYPPAGSMVFQQNRLVFPASAPGGSVWGLINTNTFDVTTVGPPQGVSWVATVGAETFALRTPFQPLEAYDDLRDLVRGQPPARVGPPFTPYFAFGSSPTELLASWFSADEISVIDPASLTPTRVLPLEDFNTWVNAIAGTDSAVLVLDDGRGSWSPSFGQRLGMFDAATGANLANVFFGGTQQIPGPQIPGFASFNPYALVCTDNP